LRRSSKLIFQRPLGYFSFTPFRHGWHQNCMIDPKITSW
jgi:hypothetical protein